VEVFVVWRRALGHDAGEEVLEDVLGLLEENLGLVLDRVALRGLQALIDRVPAVGVSVRGALEALKVVAQNCKQAQRSLLMKTNEMNANKSGPLAPWCCN
jgi:hypothetical protein